MLCLLDKTKTCRQICQLKMTCVLVRWILKKHLLVRKPCMAPSFVPLLPSGTVADPLQNTPTRLPSRSDPVSEPVRRDSDVPIDESSVAPGSMQMSPRDLTRSQGELVRSSLENHNPTTVRRRILENEPSFLLYLWLYPITWIREVCLIASQKLECHRLWSPLSRSPIAWMMNVSDEREIFEIDALGI